MSPTPCLYQETRLNLDPASADAVVDVQIPATGSFGSRLSPKRRRLDHAPFGLDEGTFAKYHLASESSIHFGPKAGTKQAKRDSAPRAIHWRLLDERKLLELQAVDLYQDINEKKEPLLTLRFSFAESIRPSGVAFAEKESEAGTHALAVFVLTASETVYNFTLRRDHFVTPDLLRDGTNRAKDWCTSFSPGSLRSGRTFKMLAKSDKELWLSRSDGSLVKLQNTGGSNWRDTVCSEATWTGSMRGLISWKANRTIRYEDADLHANTLTSFALSPAGDHVIGAALDHTIKVWDLARGKVIAHWDLAGDTDRDLQKATEALLQPTHSQRIQTVPGKHNHEYVVTGFSPRSRTFKIWSIEVDNGGDVVWTDLHPGVSFAPPPELGDASVWSLESFHFQRNKARYNEWRLWMTARLGSQSQTYTTSFADNKHAPSIERSWRDNWASTDSSFGTTKSLDNSFLSPSHVSPNVLQADGSSIAECWLSFLLHPGRFTIATLETALSIFRKGAGSTSTASGASKRLVPSRDQPLRLRLSGVVGSAAYLGPVDDEGLAFERFSKAVAGQWQDFYAIVRDLHIRREETLSLVIDPEEHLPWLTCADFVGPVRACSRAEVLWQTKGEIPDAEELHANHLLLLKLEDKEQTIEEKMLLGHLFQALATFRECLSRSFLYSFITALDSQVFTNTDVDGLDKVLSIYTQASFEDQVSDDDYNTVLDALQPLGGLSTLKKTHLLLCLELFTQDVQGRRHVKDAQDLTRYGAKALLRGSQETLNLCHEILVDLLLLVVFIGGGVEEGDLSQEFEVSEIYTELTTKLKETKFLMWMSKSTPHQEARNHQKNASQTENALTAPTADMNLFGEMCLGEWAQMKFPAEAQQQLIAYWIHAWTFGLPLDKQWHDTTVGIFGTLLIRGEVDLAMECAAFIPESSWSLYLKGRLYLLTSRPEEAATHFEAAAEGLVEDEDLVPQKLPAYGILDLEDREGINNGYGHYFLHLNRLFERAKAFGQAATFAGEGLRYTTSENGEIEAKDERLCTELCSRLFSSAIKTSQFSLAFMTLASHTDHALRDASLKTWVTSLLSANETDLLIETPYNEHGLSSLADSIISDLASEPSSNPPSVPYHKILYAFRLRQNDLRGAASCIWDRLQHLRQEQSDGLRGEDVDAETAECYLTLINCLSLVTKEQAWILYRPLESKGQDKEKRRIITLDEIRKAWQAELDRMADVAAGRFAIGGVGWMDGAADMPGSSTQEAGAMEVDVTS